MGLGAKVFNFFRPKRDPTSIKNTRLLDTLMGDFKALSDEKGNVTYVSAINAHARNFSKIQMKVFKNDELDKSRIANRINYLLNMKPNHIQSASDFYESIAKEYFGGNLVIVYLEFDYLQLNTPLKALWVVDYLSNSFKVKKTNDGDLIYSFIVDNQETYATSDEIILLTREANVRDVFGKRSKALMQTLNVINTSYQGVEKAVKTAAFIRFLITSTTPLSDNAKKEKAKYFSETFLGTDEGSGVAYADNVAEITQVNTPPKYSNAEEIKTFKDDIYEYLTITPNIIKGDYTEDQWQSYYDSALEPLLNNLALKLTDKIININEILNHQAEIRPISSKLHTASLKTRILIAQQVLKMPVIRPNVINELLYLPLLENGDKEYATLNYIEADKATEYQLNKKGKEDDSDAK